MEKFRGKDGLYHFLYKTTCNITKKYYIGIHSTDDFDDNYLGSGVELKRDIKKYGKENFEREILQFFESRENLSRAERNIVNMDVVADPDSYNLILGGDSGSLGFTVGMVTVKDSKGNTCLMRRDDPRYISGEYKFIRTGMSVYVDKYGNRINTSTNDPRVLSGELVSCSKGKLVVKRRSDGRFMQIDKDDPGLKDGTYYIDFINREGRRYLRWVRKGDQIKSIHVSELQNYLDDGWIIGNHHKGMKCITKNGVNTRVHPTELQKYLDDGWSLGTDQKYGHPASKKGQKYINKDGVAMRVPPEQIQQYLDRGWNLGMKPKKSHRS